MKRVSSLQFYGQKVSQQWDVIIIENTIKRDGIVGITEQSQQNHILMIYFEIKWAIVINYVLEDTSTLTENVAMYYSNNTFISVMKN